MGRIIGTDHKASRGARYVVKDDHDKQFSIADKQVSFSIPGPVNEHKAPLEFEQLCAVQTSSEHALRERLAVSADLLEMAWEETVGTSSGEQESLLTPSTFIHLLHSHTPDHVEAYAAWRFLRTDIAHIFFKEMKDHGRVVSFKAKDNKSVTAAKASFCQSHTDENDFCYVEGGLLP
jgi:hypothetical protein